MRKHFFAILVVLLPLGLMAQQEEYKNHNINYGIIAGQTSFKDKSDKSNSSSYDYNFWGLGLQYQYRPLNFINVFTGFDFAAGSIKSKLLTKTVNPIHGELDINVGYRFAVHPMLTLTPFIGRTSYAMNIKESNNLVENESTHKYGATNVGFLLEVYPNNQLTIGIKPMLQFTDGHEVEDKTKALGITVTNKTEYKNKVFIKIDAPVEYKISKNIGVIGTFSYNIRSLEEKDTTSAESKFNNIQAKVGLSHNF